MTRSLIPASHPRAKSLILRERLVHAFDKGLVAKEGLMAHGRGEAFDYLIGEKTSKTAKKAIKSAAALLISAKNPVISVNGNIAGLCPNEIVELSKVSGALIEINLFYSNQKRKQNIFNILRKHGAKTVLGMNRKDSTILNGIDSARRIVDKNGIYSADVVLVPLEDGDRTMALKKSGKKVITFDLNPLSRTAQTADITIVDNVVRGLREMIISCKKMKKKNRSKINFDNKKNLNESIREIKNNLTKRASYA
ncbi:MAG TPA: 4-phosphopantoate--beta-alanine ligase [Candidatus Nitrosotenuis sp.]|nr:4-phosphopantoate--beta-alanine ligase [Candidatus Nitrosotenuis sp.]